MMRLMQHLSRQTALLFALLLVTTSAQLLGLDRNPPASTILFVILTMATARPLKQPLGNDDEPFLKYRPNSTT